MDRASGENQSVPASHGLGAAGWGASMSAAVGAAISFASKPRPIEMPLQFCPAAFDTACDCGSMTMSDACWICCAMLWNALPEQSDVEMWPATLCRLVTSSVVTSVPAIVPFVTEPGACGWNVMRAAWTLMVERLPADRAG